jgi:hypothetical protein
MARHTAARVTLGEPVHSRPPSLVQDTIGLINGKAELPRVPPRTLAVGRVSPPRSWAWAKLTTDDAAWKLFPRRSRPNGHRANCVEREAGYRAAPCAHLRCQTPKTDGVERQAGIDVVENPGAGQNTERPH